MKDITVIIPVHEFNKENETLLKNALNSVDSDTQIIISCNKEIEKDIVDNIEKFSTLVEVESSNFQDLINEAVKQVNTKWFSILEFDDTYTPIWFNNVEKHMVNEPSVSVFMPLTDLIEYNEKKFIGYGNEAVWASSFSTEIGYIDNECLNNFFDFYLTGLVCNTNDWKENGGLKKSIELTFWYEFLLRMTHLQKKIFVIPRIGYVHNLNRADSLLKIYSEKFDEKTVQAYIDLAKQEQFFKNDRNKTIENNEEGE